MEPLSSPALVRTVPAVPPALPEPKTQISRVLSTRRLSDTGYELSLERHDLPFHPGMLVTVHGEEVTEDREYSIASGTGEDRLMLLYRHVTGGRLTARLVDLQPGDAVRLTGAHGQFTLRDPERPVVFVATGTGIAPCLSYFRTHPDLDLTVLHGVRTGKELFYRTELAATRYYPCISSGSTEAASTRVTARLRDLPVNAHADYYLCGAYEMIYDVRKILTHQGVDESRIHTEAYYYKAGS